MKKKKRGCLAALIVLAVLVAGAGVLAAVRWKAWFGQPEEEPYQPSDMPARALLTFGDGTELSRDITWMCDTVLKPSHIEIVRMDSAGVSDTAAIAATGEIFASRSGTAAYYHVRLSDLEPEAEYSYRIVSGDKSSQWYSFRTWAADDGGKFSFIYVGDVQDTPEGDARTILADAFRRNPDAEFLLCAGDLVERPSDRHWNEMHEVLGDLAGSMPLLNVTGNHDYLKGIPRKLERRFPLTFSYFLDSMVDGNMLYSMRYGNAEFFLLDTNREFPYLLTQRHWLKERLDSSTARWKIVVMHHPLYSVRHDNRAGRYLFEDLIADHDVDLVLQGHEHNYARRAGSDAASTPVYVISHCSPKNYRIKRTEGQDRIGAGDRYYQTIRISPDTLFYGAYRASDGALYDSLLVVKGNPGTRVTDLSTGIPEMR